jgi:hypothetical protein
MLDKTVYLERSDELDWLAGHDLLLSPYLGGGYRRIKWVDSFSSVDPSTVDPAHSVFLRLDWAQRKLVDVTGEILER